MSKRGSLLETFGYTIDIANGILKAFLTAISSLIFKASAIENFASDEVRTLVIKAHRRVLEAIVARDADAAARRMARHLSALTKQMQEFVSAPVVLR